MYYINKNDHLVKVYMFIRCVMYSLTCTTHYQTDIIEAFNPPSRYLDDLLNIENPYIEQMVGQIYLTDFS